MDQSASCRRCLPALLAALLLAGCAGGKEPARQALDDVNAVMHAVAADAATYAPLQFAAAERKRAELQFSFDQRDYASVVRAAPGVLADVGQISQLIAGLRAAAARPAHGEWVALNRYVPRMVHALHARVQALVAGQGNTAGIDVATSNDVIADADAQWEAALAAYRAGKGEEAIVLARNLKVELDSEARSLELPLPASDD